MTLEEELAKVNEDLEKAYWIFSRTKRGRLPPRELYLKRNDLEKRIREKRCSTSGSSSKSG